MNREITVRMEDVQPTVREGPAGPSKAYLLLGGNGEGHHVLTAVVPPGYVIEAHYHDVDQFQIIMAGSGTIGGEPIFPGTVHYSDAHVPYGPIVAGPEGLTFMVVRPYVNPGAKITFSRDVIAKVKEVQSKKALQRAK